jgi:hypothetical protein
VGKWLGNAQKILDSFWAISEKYWKVAGNAQITLIPAAPRFLLAERDDKSGK